MNQTTRKNNTQLKAGDIVRAHGGRFKVLADARYSTGHLASDGVGPSDCSVAPAICLEGEVRGYFRPGSDWTFQGNQLAAVYVECAA